MDQFGSFGAIRVLLDKGTPTPKWDDISSSREQARTPPYEVHIVPTAATLTTRPSHPQWAIIYFYDIFKANISY